MFKLTLSLFLIILLFGCSGMKDSPIKNDTNKPQPIPEQNTTQIDNSTNLCDDRCHFEKADKNADVLECKKISTSSGVYDCLTYISDRSLEACKLLDLSDKKIACISKFAKTDPILCSVLGSKEFDCVALVSGCSKTDFTCQSKFYNDAKFCNQDSACLLEFAFSKKNADYCNSIQNAAIKGACTFVLSSNQEACSNLVAAQRDYCYELSATYTNDSTYCSYIPSGEYRVNCFSTLAASQKTISLCEQKDITLDDRWHCYTNYSLLSGDFAGCKKIDKLATTNQFKCVFEFAKKFGSATSCELIEDISNRGTCYQGVILYTPQNIQTSGCAGVTDQSWRNKCYLESAKTHSDISICDNIADAAAITNCRSLYTSAKGTN